MLRKFECKQCHCIFEADDQKAVTCPHCQSDNVDYAHFHIHKGMWKWGMALLAIIAIGIITVYFMNHHQTETEQKSEDTLAYECDTSGTFVAEIVDLPHSPKVNIVGKMPKYESDGYSFKVMVTDAPDDRPFYVAVLDCENHNKVIAKSNEKLEFTKVPPSDNKNGQYDLGVFDAATNALLGTPSTRSGFYQQESVATRMTAQELQRLIETDDPSLMGMNENKFIAADCKLNFTNLPADDRRPESLYDITDMIHLGQWKGVKVVSVTHDTMNRIVAATFQIIVNDSDEKQETE